MGDDHEAEPTEDDNEAEAMEDDNKAEAEEDDHEEDDNSLPAHQDANDDSAEADKMAQKDETDSTKASPAMTLVEAFEAKDDKVAQEAEAEAMEEIMPPLPNREDSDFSSDEVEM